MNELQAKRDRFDLLIKVVERAEQRAVEQGAALDRMTTIMDIEHADDQFNLDLAALLVADNFNFTHDVFGIINHIDRRTGLVGDCFVPRYARG